MEDLICHLFLSVPGIEIAQRNALNSFKTEEVDVALWNRCILGGLPFLPNVILAECKNWSQAVGSQEVAYFATRLRNRGCDHGILIAASGITGIPAELTRAHYEMAMALSQGQRILVLSRNELENLTHSSQLVALLKRKICELVVSGTSLEKGPKGVNLAQ
jgi:hypothetical protein